MKREGDREVKGNMAKDKITTEEKKTRASKKGIAANGIQPKSISLEAHVTESKEKKHKKIIKGLSLLGCCLLLRRLRTGCRLGHAA